MRARYDAIVVGSGLGGLTAANVLARCGRKVLVLEQHYNYGGLATWFKRRGGHVFDVSLHGFPASMKKTCRATGARPSPRASCAWSRSASRTRSSSSRRSSRARTSRASSSSASAQDRARVESFYAELAKMDFFSDSGETTAQLFERHFPGRNDVHRLLMEPITYANGSTLDDPAISYGIVFSNFMSSGVYTFRGGTDWLVKEMQAELVKNGVELRNHVQVERIVVENGRVRGIEAHGRFVASEVVVSNASLKTTAETLVGSQHFDSSFAAGLRAVRLNNSSTQVYIGLRAGSSIPFVTDLLFTSTRPTFDSPALSEMHGESRTFSFYYPKTRPGSQRYTIVSSMNAHWADWAELDERRYAAEKLRLQQDTLAALERHVPGVGALIDHVEVSTPRTFAFYTQHPQGTSFGTKFEGLRYSLDLPKQVAGLYHAGSVGIIMSGWLGAANYGVITANKADAFLHSHQELTT